MYATRLVGILIALAFIYIAYTLLVPHSGARIARADSAKRATLEWAAHSLDSEYVSGQVGLIDRRCRAVDFGRSVDDCNAIVDAAVNRRRDSLESLRVAFRNTRAEGASRSLVLWGIFNIQAEESASFMIECLPDRDANIRAAARKCLERLALAPAREVLNGADEVSGWNLWYSRNTGITWDDRLRALLEERGVGIGSNNGHLAFSELQAAAKVFRIDWREIPEECNVETPLSREVLIMMRVSELLCTTSWRYDVSPVTFPQYYPDRSWRQWDPKGRQWEEWYR